MKPGFFNSESPTSGPSQWQILLSEVKRNKSPSFSAVQQITSGW